MSDLRQAAQMALEALDGDHPDIQLRAAITLRAALAQPEPFNPDWDRVEALEASLREHMEEVQKWKSLCKQLWDKEMPKTICGPNLEEVLNAAGFYKRKPLSEATIDTFSRDKNGLPNSHLEFARAIEAAHGIGGEP